MELILVGVSLGCSVSALVLASWTMAGYRAGEEHRKSLALDMESKAKTLNESIESFQKAYDAWQRQNSETLQRVETVQMMVHASKASGAIPTRPGR